jgi:DNA-binding PadR family transcriptional regulator
MGVSAKAALTTTSYALLGLLAQRAATTYELARLSSWTLRYAWPRAESKLYEEPKKLVGHGLARSSPAFTGRRRRTFYEITESGRSALREWLARPGGGPVLEFEGLVKVGFADFGTRDALLATIRRVRGEAEEMLELGRGLARRHAAPDGPEPERLHVNVLAWRYLWEQWSAVARWAAWAEADVQTWDATSPAPERTDAARRTLLAEAGTASAAAGTRSAPRRRVRRGA